MKRIEQYQRAYVLCAVCSKRGKCEDRKKKESMMKRKNKC